MKEEELRNKFGAAHRDRTYIEDCQFKGKWNRDCGGHMKACAPHNKRHIAVYMYLNVHINIRRYLWIKENMWKGRWEENE